jgi:hypothetical protein
MSQPASLGIHEPLKSTRAAQYVRIHLLDRARYLDARVDEARKEMNSLTR